MKQVLTIWLFLLSTLIASALPHTSAAFSVTFVRNGEAIAPLAFDYDGVIQGKVDYDDLPKGELDYDGMSMPPANGNGIASCAGRSLFGNFVEFLAAETTAVQPVFWSGGQAAEDAARAFANANNGVVIGDTAAGQALSAATQGVPWSEARPQWLQLSQGFAGSASGEVNVFQNSQGVFLNSIWRDEYQVLINNPNVTTINFHVVMPNGSVVPVP